MKITLLFLALITSFYANAQWQPAGLDSVKITSLDAGDSSIFVGTKGGVYVSNDYGNTWTYNDFPPSIYPVLTVAKKGLNVFAGSNNNMKKSSDGGLTWGREFAFVNFPIHSIIVNDGNIFSASQLGVHISVDNGKVWTNVSTGLPALESPTKLVANGSDIYVVADSSVFLSTNNGELWDIANTGLTNNPVHTLAINGSVVFAGTGNGVFVSTNKGALWTPANSGLPNTPVYSLAISGIYVFAATDSGVFVSANNGASWISINTGLPDNHARFLTISGDRVFAGLSAKTAAGQLWSKSLSELVGTSNTNSDPHFNLYPNPSAGKFKISGTETGIQTIDIYNIRGQNVFHSDTGNGNTVNEIDLSKYPKGMYFVNITDNLKAALVRKIIVE